MKNRLHPYRYWLVVLWLMAFAAFHMAWTAHPAAAFTLNGFDLAEQISVHPAIRAESPPFRSSAMIWFAVPMIAAGLTFSALLFDNTKLRWLLYGIAFLIALRVIPPEKALRSPRTLFEDDYARLLSLLTLLGVGAVLLSVFLRKRLHLHTGIIQLIVNGLALSIPAIGFYRAFDLLQQLQLDVTVGGGAIFYAGILVIIAVRIIMPRATPAQEMTKSPIRASVFDR